MMDSFVKRGKDVEFVVKKAPKTNFLAEVTALKVENERDVGLDKLGDMRNNLPNVVQYFDLVKELGNVKAEFQQLLFSDNFPSEEYKLIEVDQKTAEDFENGQSLVFRGEVDDFVVLCSKDRSYSVKEVETSNSLLICPKLRFSNDMEVDGRNTLESREVTGLCHHYLELKAIECVSPYRIREKLTERMLNFDWMNDEAENDTSNTYSYNELLNCIQMSEEEMRSILKKMPVVEHKGKLRYLSHNLRDKLIVQLTEACDDEEQYPNFDINLVNYDILRKYAPQQFTDEIIKWFLSQYCTSVRHGDYVMNEDAIVRDLSSYLLRQVSRIELAVLEKQMNYLLPTGMTFNIDYLAGLALVEDSFKGKYVSYLNVEDLPELPRDRLKLLFEKKNSWLMEEVAPYISDICKSNKAMNALMVSHCRTMKSSDGRKVFCSLKPV